MTPANILAIASGKGGVGKTWFAITTAHALARGGRRVLLFDADLGLANVDIQLGLTPACDLADVLAGRATLAEAVVRHEEAGFDIMAGRSGSGALASLDAAAIDELLDALRDATARYDAVLLDLGAGVDRTGRRLAAGADTLVVLATEEPTSITDAYAVLKLHSTDRPGGDQRVVINQAPTATAGERTYGAIARAAVQFLGRAPSLAGVVRRDRAVPVAIRRQALLLTRAPNSHAAVDVERIAEGLLVPAAVMPTV
jgi:flagellar biosynthesis protein FlhG